MAHCLMQEISYTKVGFYATVRDLGHTIMIFDVFTRLRLRLYCTHLNRDMTATVTATAIQNPTLHFVKRPMEKLGSSYGFWVQLLEATEQNF